MTIEREREHLAQVEPTMIMTSAGEVFQVAARSPDVDISQGQPGQPQPDHRRTGDDAQNDVHSVGNTPQPPWMACSSSYCSRFAASNSSNWASVIVSDPQSLSGG